jgi:hypothetical protein
MTMNNKYFHPNDQPVHLIHVILGALAIIVTIGCGVKNSRNIEKINIDSLKLSELQSFAWKEWTDTVDIDPTRFKFFNNFNFIQMREVDSANSKYLLKVFYNKENEITQIRKLFLGSKDVFDFRVIQNRKWNCTMLVAKYRFEPEPVTGFIIIYNNHCYFIGFHQDPFCIMELDSHLKTLRTLRFCSNELIYQSKITYFQAQVYSEIFSAPDKSFAISKETVLTEVLNQFNSNVEFKFEREIKIGWLPEWTDLELWFFAGMHDFGRQLAPSYEESPSPELNLRCMRRMKN